MNTTQLRAVIFGESDGDYEVVTSPESLVTSLYKYHFLLNKIDIDM